MNEIPEDILQAAREVAMHEQFRLSAWHGTSIVDERTIEAIARAIMAERQKTIRGCIDAIASYQSDNEYDDQGLDRAVIILDALLLPTQVKG